MRLPNIIFPLLIILSPMAAQALESAPAKAEFSSIRLVTGELKAGEAPEAVLEAAVEVTIDKGWKTYWRSPGDAGFPMMVVLEPDAANVEKPEIHWPFSTRFVEEWGLEVFGFKDKALIPVSFTIPDRAQASKVSLRVSYAVCSDICINQEHKVALDIPAGYQADAAHAKRIAKALQSVPAVNGTDGLKVGQLRVESEDVAANKGMLQVEVALPQGKDVKADVFIEGPAGFRFPNPELVWQGKDKPAVFLVPYEISPPAKSLYGTPLRLTLVQGNKAVEAELTVPEGKPEEKPEPKEEKKASASSEVQVADAEGKKPGFWSRLQKRFRSELAAEEYVE